MVGVISRKVAIDSRKFIKYSAKAKVFPAFFVPFFILSAFCLCRLTMCGVVVKHFGHINAIFVLPALRRTLSLSRSYSLYIPLFRQLHTHSNCFAHSHCFARAMQLISNPIAFLFAVRSYLENSIYFQRDCAISIAFCCQFSSVQLQLQFQLAGLVALLPQTQQIICNMCVWHSVCAAI